MGDPSSYLILSGHRLKGKASLPDGLSAVSGQNVFYFNAYLTFT